MFNQSKPEWVKKINCFHVMEGTLYRHELPSQNSKRSETNYQLVLPLRYLVLKELHVVPMGIH